VKDGVAPDPCNADLLAFLQRWMRDAPTTLRECKRCSTAVLSERGSRGVARDNNTTRDYSARFIDELRLRFHPEPFTFLPCCVSLGTMTTAVSPWYEFEGVL
jgi:hypothetical protein